MTANDVLRWVALSTGLLLCTGNSTAWAQSAADKAAADSLFNEGKQLIAKGDNAAACGKFESSLAKLAQLGTRIALATCYEKVGKTASAWGAFRAAASAARKAHDKRQKFADERASALEARLSKLRITLAGGERVAGLAIKRDGAEVTPAELGSDVPLDPGEHVVEASAPGRAPWSSRVSIPPVPGVVEVSVPALEKVAVDNVPEPREPRSTRRTVGYVVGAGGIAIIGASLIVGAVARSNWNDVHRSCPDVCEDPATIDKAEHARTLGNVATGTFVAGSVVIAAGVILWLTAPSAEADRAPAHATALHLVPYAGPTQVGVALQGGF